MTDGQLPNNLAFGLKDSGLLTQELIRLSDKRETLNYAIQRKILRNASLIPNSIRTLLERVASLLIEGHNLYKHCRREKTTNKGRLYVSK